MDDSYKPFISFLSISFIIVGFGVLVFPYLFLFVEWLVTLPSLLVALIMIIMGACGLYAVKLDAVQDIIKR